MRLLKRLFWGGAILLLLLSAGVIIYVQVNKDKILAACVDEINSHLAVQVNVSDVDISLYESWPSVAILLKGVSINSEGFERSLLESGDLSVRFNTIDLIRGNYLIQSILLKEAVLNFEVNSEGSTNFQIFKSQKNDSVRSETVELDKLILKNSTVSYHNRSGSQNTQLSIDLIALDCDLNLGNEELRSSSDFSGKFNKIQINNQQYLTNASIDGQAELTFRRSEKTLHWAKTNLNIGGIEVKSSTGVLAIENLRNLEVSLNTEFFSIQDLITLLPSKTIKNLEQYQLSGNCTVQVQLAGNLKNTDKLQSKIKFQGKGVNLYYPKNDLQFTKHELTGIYSSNNGFNIKKGKISGFTSTGLVENESTEIRIGSLLTDVSAYYGEISGDGKTETFEKVYSSESIDLQQGSFSYLLNFQKANKEFLLDGEFDLSNLSFRSKPLDLEFTNLNGDVLFNNEEIAIQQLVGKVADSDFKISGHLVNPSGVSEGNSNPFFLSGSLESEYLNLNDLLQFYEAGEQPNETRNNNIVKDYTIPDKVNLDLSIDLGKLVYKKFHGQKVEGKLQIKDQIINGTGITFNSIGGHVNGSFVANTKDNFISCVSTVSLENLEIDSIFYVFNNFDQDFIKDNHLRGQITADIKTNLHLTKNLTPIYKTVKSQIDARVNNGQLVQFEPMMRLSRFVEESQLEQMSFDEMTNIISIKDSKVSIPEMKIRSNISNIELSGWHTFDQRIEYHLKVPLKRAYKKDKDERFGTIAENEDNLTNIFLKIIGTTDNYDIRYDQKMAIRNIKEEIKAEGKELIQSIKSKGKSTENNSQLQLKENDFFDFDEDSVMLDSLSSHY